MLMINSDYETQVFNTLQPYLLLQGEFSNGYFIYNSDTFDINKQGVVSLRKDVSLDRETKDNYILQVQIWLYTSYCNYVFYIHYSISPSQFNFACPFLVRSCG